jgi:hypothetical protein
VNMFVPEPCKPLKTRSGLFASAHKIPFREVFLSSGEFSTNKHRLTNSLIKLCIPIALRGSEPQVSIRTPRRVRPPQLFFGPFNDR